MKKFFAVSFLLFVLMHTLTSQATLENAMKGRRVKDQIILFIQSENAVDFKIDFNDRNKKTLEKENYLQAQDQEFRVYVDFFNPLQYRMTTEDIEIDDELFQASNAYISVARDFLTTIGGMASVGGGGATARKSYETPVSGAPDNFVTNDPNVAELYILFRDFDSTFFGSNEGKIILNLLRKLNVDLVHSKISTDLKGAFSSLQKIKRLEEIEKAKSENSKIMSDIDKSLQDLKGVLDSLELQIASLPTSPTKIDLVEKSVLKFKVGGLKKLSEDLKDNVTKIIVKYKKIELLFDDSRIDNDEKRLKIAGIVNLNTSKRR